MHLNVIKSLCVLRFIIFIKRLSFNVSVYRYRGQCRVVCRAKHMLFLFWRANTDDTKLQQPIYNKRVK